MAPPKIKKEEVARGRMSDIHLDREAKIKSKDGENAVKEELKHIRLDPEQVERRYAGVNDEPIKIELDPETVNRTISRAFFSSRYGGNRQMAFSEPKAEHVEAHGIKQIAFLKPAWGPFLPKRPGERGLSFEQRTYEEVMPVFVRQDAGGWLYVGHHRFTPSMPLTTEEWACQNPEFHQVWIDTFFKTWAEEPRARILLRKQLGREPEPGEVLDAVERKRFTVKPADVMNALNNGTEKIQVRVMHCVEYNEEFQKEVVNGFDEYEAERKRKLEEMMENEEVDEVEAMVLDEDDWSRRLRKHARR